LIDYVHKKKDGRNVSISFSLQFIAIFRTLISDICCRHQNDPGTLGYYPFPFRIFVLPLIRNRMELFSSVFIIRSGSHQKHKYPPPKEKKENGILDTEEKQQNIQAAASGSSGWN
jgi:hypothetical protein